MNELIISEREKRIKSFSKQSGKNKRLIISELVGYNVSTAKSEFLKEFKVKRKRKSSENSENNETGIFISKKSRRSSLCENDLQNKKCNTRKVSSGDKDCDNVENGFVNNVDKNSCSNLSRLNSTFKTENSLEVNGKKKRKRKITVTENEDNSSGNSSNLSRSNLDISTIQSEENTSEKTCKDISLHRNGFNDTSTENSLNEEFSSKKIKKRKNSSSFKEIKTDDAGSSNHIFISKGEENSVTNQKSIIPTSVNHEKGKIKERKKKKSKESLNDLSFTEGEEVRKVNDEVDNYTDKESCNHHNESHSTSEKPRLSLSGSSGFFWNVNAKDFSVGGCVNEVNLSFCLSVVFFVCLVF